MDATWSAHNEHSTSVVIGKAEEQYIYFMTIIQWVYRIHVLDYQEVGMGHI